MTACEAGRFTSNHSTKNKSDNAHVSDIPAVVVLMGLEKFSSPVSEAKTRSILTRPSKCGLETKTNGVHNFEVTQCNGDC